MGRADVGAAAPSSLDWWQFYADVAAAVGTLSAVVVAVSIAVMDSRRRDRESRDAEAAQARLLAIADDASARATGSLGAVITNNSTGSMLDVRIWDVELRCGGRAQAAVAHPVATSMNTHEEDLVAPLLGRGGGHSVAFTFTDLQGAPIELTDSHALILSLSYTDPYGLRWVRRGSGHPKRILGGT